MQIQALKSKIHRATVVQAELDYVGSITIDEVLMEQAGILEYEKAQTWFTFYFYWKALLQRFPLGHNLGEAE